MMLPVYEPVGLSESSIEGTSLPIVLDCVAGARGIRPIFTKYVHHPRLTSDGLLREMMGSALARMLGIPTPSMSIVRINDEAAELLNSEIEERGMADRRVYSGLALGFDYLPHLLPIPIPPDLDTMMRMSHGALIFGLDLSLQNCDRIPDNPNCSYLGDGIVAYDFENCLECDPRMDILGEPWEVAEHRGGPDHVFYSKLRGKPRDFKALAQLVAKCDEEAVRSLIALAPVEWHGRAEEMLRFLGKLRAHAADLPVQLNWSLA